MCRNLIGENEMIQDLHVHTYYSFCGKDSPEEVVEKAIAGGIEMTITALLVKEVRMCIQYVKRGSRITNAHCNVIMTI